MTPILTTNQELFFVILTMVLFAALIGDFRNARLFRAFRNRPSPWKDLAKDMRIFFFALLTFMAVATDKTNLMSRLTGGDWLPESAIESVEGGRYNLMEGGGSTEGASGITWAMLSGLPPFTSNAVLTASQYLGGFACVCVTNIQPSALDAPSNAVVYTDWPYAVARQSVPLPQGCLPDGFTFGGRTVTNLYVSASGMLSFDGPKSSPMPATNGIPDGTAANYIAVLQTPSDIVPTNGLFWYAPGTNSSVFTWKDVFLGQDTNCLATVQAELYADGDFTCRYLFPSATNNYAQLTNFFLIGAQNNSGGETVLYTNALLAINDSFFPAFELQWKSLAGLDPAVPDRDSDGFSDADELFIYHTDPRRDDTDGDGIPDAAEIANGTDPLNPDENNDGIPDGVDLTGYSLSDTNLVFKLINGIAPGVDPLLDSDNDGWADWLELRFGTDPNYFSSTPDGLDTYFSVTVTLASPPTEPGVLAVGCSRVLVTGPGSWVFWRTPGEAHPVSFTSAHGVPPPFALSFNRPTAARYDMPVPDGKGGDFGKAALPRISFDPAAAVCCHKTRTAEYCQTYTANVMPPMPGTYEWGTYAWAGGGGTWSTNAPNVVAVGHGVNWLRLRFTPCGASAYRDAWLWTDRHCSGPMIEPYNPGVVSVNNNDDDADETRDDTDTEITGGDPDLAELWPLSRSGSLCCQCPGHHPSATLASSSQKLALYMDSGKADAFSGTVHAGDAVYVEGLAPSTEPYAEKLVWQWTEDNETKSLTNALTVLSVRLFPDLDNDDDVDATDIAGFASLSSEYGWLMPASTNVLRKMRLRTDVGLSGGAYTLTLSGDAGAFKVWADNSDTNTAPLLVCGQTVTNGVGGVTFRAGDDTDLYVEAASNGTATITYSYAGAGDASNITAAAWLKMTAFKVNLLEVGFSGSGEHILKKTGGDTWTNDTYTSEGDRMINDPVWKDMNLDGDVSEIDDTNDPVCFNRSSSPVIHAKFMLSPVLLTTTNLHFFAELNTGINTRLSYNSQTTIVGNEILVTFTTTNQLANEVFNGIWSIDFRCDIGGLLGVCVGATEHKAFITYATPIDTYDDIGDNYVPVAMAITAKRMNIACEWAKLMNTTNDVASSCDRGVQSTLGFDVNNYRRNPFEGLDERIAIDCISWANIAAMGCRLLGIDAHPYRAWCRNNIVTNDPTTWGWTVQYHSYHYPGSGEPSWFLGYPGNNFQGFFYVGTLNISAGIFPFNGWSVGIPVAVAPSKGKYLPIGMIEPFTSANGGLLEWFVSGGGYAALCEWSPSFSLSGISIHSFPVSWVDNPLNDGIFELRWDATLRTLQFNNGSSVTVITDGDYQLPSTIGDIKVNITTNNLPSTNSIGDVRVVLPHSLAHIP